MAAKEVEDMAAAEAEVEPGNANSTSWASAGADFLSEDAPCAERQKAPPVGRSMPSQAMPCGTVVAYWAKAMAAQTVTVESAWT